MNTWICSSEYNFEDKNFWKIIDFYVLKTPVNNVSQRGISFDKRNLNKNHVLNTIKKMSPGLSSIFVYIDETESVEEQLKKNGIFKHLDNPFEYAIFKKQSDKCQTDSFFYYIRCALAHGSFCVHKDNNTTFYYFENLHKEKGKRKYTLNARMILKEETLLKIIDLCNSKM